MSERSPHPEVSKYLNELDSIKERSGSTDMEAHIQVRKQESLMQAREDLSEMQPISNDVRRILNMRCANPWCVTPRESIVCEILPSGNMIPVCERHANTEHTIIQEN